MATPRVLIVRAPGTNCDQETAYAFDRAGARSEVLHLNRWLEKPSLVGDYQILCFPGGFSYGDDIAAGRIVATWLKRHLNEVLGEFVARDRLVLGICNGFQVLLKSGFLLHEPQGVASATLNWNDSGRFEARWIHLDTDPGTPCVFLKGVQRMTLPIAHAEGKFVARSDTVLDALAARGQLALRYATPTGPATAETGFPDNPNGSQRHVAGVCDETGRVFGLMPHPERYLDRTHHPAWTRMPKRAAGDGAIIFANAVGYFGS